MNINKHVQITKLGNVPTKQEFDVLPETFLLKNITDDFISVTILPVDNDQPINTILHPGWNPEICKKVFNASSGTLQYGY